MQKGAEPVLVEYSTHVCDSITTYDRVSSLDKFYMQDINSIIHSPNDLHYVENIMNHEIERYSSQYEDKEAESYASSNEGEVSNLMYYEEASCEDNEESCYSSQEEDSDRTWSSSCESDANWEEESNDGSEYSYERKGMSSFSKPKSEVPFQSYTSQVDAESCEDDLSIQYEEKEIIHNDKLPNCVDECLEDICSSNQQCTNDSEVNVSAPFGKINDNWYARHLNYLHEDNDRNFDLYSICFVDGVDVESSYSSDFSSHAEILHEDEMGSELKVYTNTLHNEDCDDDQPISCQSVQKASLHGVISPVFEEDMECLDLVEDCLNDDTLSYYYKRLDFFSSRCDSDYDDDVASHEVYNKVFDEAVNENQHAPCNEFYDEEHSNEMTNPSTYFKVIGGSQISFRW